MTLGDPVYLHAGLYPKYLAEIAALADEGYNIVLTDHICFEPETSANLVPTLPRDFEFSKPTQYWIDEAPSVGTIGLTPKPQLSFLARCIRQCYGKSFDDIDLAHALHPSPL